ncbi:tRNA lysidine(34) synthetase TilS [Latilactobacillus fuchuensis]|uniref:tRNA lysidine(34) synthetase TilS n=1 Tax=Latilactobacillus fuchuensis TaxID=164393 RepID=UPI0020C7ED87|nr:tRNA lysidine(34) synthetase TilS [Latilactobacillus fuchuensis]MCP8857239.1 tRNA lysidine(34) synthetase TilS [Latilactobacillus fuchuensis]
MLTQVFQKLIKEQQFWQPGEKVVVATSTGVDSMVLLQLLTQLPTALKPVIIVAHVNHELRTQSAAEENYLRKFCQQQELTLKVAHWPANAHPTTGIEAAARQFRYHFFESVMQTTGAKVLLTAHHGDDQLETLVMKLIRSGELHEMRGIQARRLFGPGQLVRPLLPFSKAMLRDFATQQAIRFFEDETNESLTVLRNRVRHQIVPQLKQENPQIIQNANRFSTRLSAVLAVQNDWAMTVVKLMVRHKAQTELVGDLTIVQQFTPVQQRLIWQQLWRTEYPGLPALKSNQLTELIQFTNQQAKPQGQIDLGHDYALMKVYDQFIIQSGSPQESVATTESAELTVNQWCSLPNTERIGVFDLEHLPQKVTSQQVIWLTSTDWPLTVQQLTGSERLAIGHEHTKSIKRLFIDLKWSQRQRQNSWGVWSRNQLIGHPQLRVSALFNQPQTGKIRYVLCCD